MDLGYHKDLVFYVLEKNLRLAEDRSRGPVEFRARFTRSGLDRRIETAREGW